VHYFAQLSGILGHDNLQRREHSSLDEVAVARCPVRQPEHDVYVQARAVAVLSDVTD